MSAFFQKGLLYPERCISILSTDETISLLDDPPLAPPVSREYWTLSYVTPSSYMQLLSDKEKHSVPIPTFDSTQYHRTTHTQIVLRYVTRSTSNPWPSKASCQQLQRTGVGSAMVPTCKRQRAAWPPRPATAMSKNQSPLSCCIPIGE